MSSSFSTNLHWRTGEAEAATPLTRSTSPSEWMSNANDHSSMVTRSVHALARGVSVPSRFGESRSLGEEPVPRTGDSRLVLRAAQEDAREGAPFGEQIVQGSGEIFVANPDPLVSGRPVRGEERGLADKLLDERGRHS